MDSLPVNGRQFRGAAVNQFLNLCGCGHTPIPAPKHDSGIIFRIKFCLTVTGIILVDAIAGLAAVIPPVGVPEEVALGVGHIVVALQFTKGKEQSWFTFTLGTDVPAGPFRTRGKTEVDETDITQVFRHYDWSHLALDRTDRTAEIAQMVIY